MSSSKAKAYGSVSGLIFRIVLVLYALRSAGAAAPEFLTAPTYPVGNSPVAIVAADFNGDGHQDLAVASGGRGPGEVDVVLGNGSGGFDSATSHVAGHSLTGIAAGDFNGDHLPDVVVSNGLGLGGFDILLSTGRGNLHTAVHIAGGSNAQSIAVGDFDHDGHFDVALADLGGGLIVFLGHGDGTFATPKIFASGTNFLHLISIDVNHDGKLDLVAATQSSIEVYLGSGNGGFGAPHSQSFGPGKIDSFALGDFNGGGKLDLVVDLYNSVSFDGRILSSPGRGNGTFAGPGQSFSRGPGVAAASAVNDFDRDGNLDLMLASSFANQCGGDSVNVISGNGDGTFRAPVLFGVGADPHGIALFDFNNDGKMDAVTANNGSNNVSLLLGMRAADFRRHWST